MGKSISDANNIRVVRLEHCGELANRHARHEEVTRYTGNGAGRVVLDAHRGDLGGIAFYSDDPMTEMNFRSAPGDPTCDLFPHLTGSEFGIQKAFNQAGFRPSLSGIRCRTPTTGNRVHNRFSDGKSFDALSAPFRRNLLAPDPPDFLGVVLEKSPV